MKSVLTDQLPFSILGLQGTKPNFKITPEPPGSRHLTYSINGNPKIQLIGINKIHPLPSPSRLDLNGARPSAYMDNPPK